MTTAHRATWSFARGSANQGGAYFHVPSQHKSVLDMPANLDMKTRDDAKFGKMTEEERKALAEALNTTESKELLAKVEKGGEYYVDEADLDAEVARLDALDKEEVDYGSSSDDSSDESDEEAELMRELEKVKAERAAEKLQRQQEEEERQKKEMDAAVMTSNPLLGGLANAGGYTNDRGSVKRRWTDETFSRTSHVTGS